MSNQLTPWMVLNSIIDKKKTYTQEEVEQQLNLSLLIKYLSNNNTTLGIAEYLNNNYRMSLYDMYLFAQNITPKSVGMIKYNKREKEEKIVDIEYIMEYYNTSYNVGLQYYKEMSDKQFDKIKSIVNFWRGEKMKVHRERI